jgi:hypothetical protein
MGLKFGVALLATNRRGFMKWHSEAGEINDGKAVIFLNL